METFVQYIKRMIQEAASYAATAKAGERDWHSQLTDTSKSKNAVPARPLAPAGGDTAHREKMFGFHAKMHAAAKARGDTAGMAYHQSKLKSYG